MTKIIQIITFISILFGLNPATSNSEINHPKNVTSFNYYGHDVRRTNSYNYDYKNTATFLFVGPKGRDNNECKDSNNPCSTLNFALQFAEPGSTILMRGGVYNQSVQIKKNGTKEKPIIISSFPGEWAIFKGDGVNLSNNDNKIFYIHGASYLKFRNFEVRNARGRMHNDRVSVGGITLKGNSNNITFENIYCHSNGGTGFTHLDASYIEYKWCTSENNWDKEKKGQSGDGWSVSSGHDIYWYNCVASRNSDDGFDCWISKNNRFEDCVAFSNGYDEKGNGCGFKLGGNSEDDGGHIMISCISMNNKRRGFAQNSSDIKIIIMNSVAYNNGNSNYELGYGKGKIAVINSISMGEGQKGDMINNVIGSECNLGGHFGSPEPEGIEFESLDYTDLNNINEKRFFYPSIRSSVLIDKGKYVVKPFFCLAPDIGAREFKGY